MDKTIIERKIIALIDLLDKLKTILKLQNTNQEFSTYFIFAAEKKAEEIVDLACSINQELLKSKGKLSTSYFESFTDLKIFKEFSEAELQKLATTAGFRNRLAHDYLTVDEKIAIKTMENMLKIYPSYLTKIQKILTKPSK